MTIRHFGDSIAAGEGASAPERAWTAVLDRRARWPVPAEVYAANNHMAFDIAPSVYGQTIGRGDVATMMLGVNDERIWGEKYAGLFQNTIGALAAWLAMEAGAKVPALTADAVTYGGSWSQSEAYGLGKYSCDEGAWASFRFSGDVVYLGMTRQRSTGGECAFTVDGKSVYAGWRTIISAPETPKGKVGHGPSLVRLAGFGPGEHEAKITVTSAAGEKGGVFFDWYATPKGGPKVFLAAPSRKAQAGYETYGGSDYSTIRYANAIDDICRTLSQDGLNVYPVRIDRLINPLTDLRPTRQGRHAVTPDGVHPDDVGHLIIADAFIEAFSNQGVL
ncbi:MAG: hypothetical protein AAGB11_05895 [Pseudomonadota bacterium]